MLVNTFTSAQNLFRNSYNNLPALKTVKSVAVDKPKNIALDAISLASDALGYASAKPAETTEKPKLLMQEIVKTRIPPNESHWHFPFSNAALVFNFDRIKEIPLAMGTGALLCGTGILGLAYETGLSKKWPFLSERLGKWPSEAADSVGYLKNTFILPTVSGLGQLIASTNESPNANLIFGLSSLYIGYRLVWKSPSFTYLDFKFNDKGKTTCSFNAKNFVKDIAKIASGVSFVAGGILLVDKSLSGTT